MVIHVSPKAEITKILSSDLTHHTSHIAYYFPVTVHYCLLPSLSHLNALVYVNILHSGSLDTQGLQVLCILEVLGGINTMSGEAPQAWLHLRWFRFKFCLHHLLALYLGQITCKVGPVIALVS